MANEIKIVTPELLAEQAETAMVRNDAGASNVSAAARQFAEVKGAIQLAREFPREELAAFKQMRRTCSRPAFADEALYAYPRGGKMITGASIRLIEELVRAYHNIDYGFRILESREDASLIEAFAWDVENNIKARREFWVQHIRETSQGNVALKNPRDIYELCANMAQRRVRACVEEIIPIDLIEEAKALCHKTMKIGSNGMPFQDRVREMVLAFDEYGVSRDMIEQYLGHPVEAMIVEEMPKLKQAYQALKTSMATRDEIFKPGKKKIASKPVVKSDPDPTPAPKQEPEQEPEPEKEELLKASVPETSQEPASKTQPDPPNKQLELLIAYAKEQWGGEWESRLNAHCKLAGYDTYDKLKPQQAEIILSIQKSKKSKKR
jgi:hypothetical protein